MPIIKNPNIIVMPTPVPPQPSGERTDQSPFNDVNFIDYDGTILYSYSRDEFLALSSLPDFPDSSELTYVTWNWSLDDAKIYVTEYDNIVIGAIVKPSDDKIKYK